MTTQKKTVNDIKPFTTVQASIVDSEGGFLVMTQGRGTGLLIINKGIPYGFTYPAGGAEEARRTITNVFVIMNDENPDEEMLALRNSLKPMDEDKQGMLEVLSTLMPMQTVAFIPASDFDKCLELVELESGGMVH